MAPAPAALSGAASSVFLDAHGLVAPPLGDARVIAAPVFPPGIWDARGPAAPPLEDAQDLAAPPHVDEQRSGRVAPANFTCGIGTWNCASLFGATIAAPKLFHLQRAKRKKLRALLSRSDFFMLQEVHGSSPDAHEMECMCPSHSFFPSLIGATGGLLTCVRSKWLNTNVSHTVLIPGFASVVAFDTGDHRIMLFNVHIHPKWDNARCIECFK